MEFCVVDGEATEWSQYFMPEAFLLQNVQEQQVKQRCNANGKKYTTIWYQS
jgi:hypothetical protein